MIPSVDIPVSWFGPVAEAVVPWVPLAAIGLGIFMIWGLGGDTEFDGLGGWGLYLIVIGVLGCIAEVFLFGWVRLV